ncbi:MAG: GYD domain-containing protein [Nitrospirae bacterium]|nr:GYD domain-containing protein [Nitrospirota bacterium]MBU6481672.1 GYD domain-containing protein [Nitrospirota bacterium]MDE3042552.1 GYD domain-containing protein [Nitrospirota bacterium]MDE3220317.1 GYD domain-containing protein [Nitrospirota bacterium]
MAMYIALVNFTDQGVRNLKDTTKRADAAKEMAKKFGVTFKELYWTLGSYDEVIVFDAPDDASMASFLASVGSLGNIRTQTLRAFSQAEMKGILAKLG